MGWEIHREDLGSESSSQLDQSVCSHCSSVIRFSISSLRTEQSLRKTWWKEIKTGFRSLTVQPCEFSEKTSSGFTRAEKHFKHREVSRNNAKFYSHKQNKKIHSPCCAGTCIAILSRSKTIACNLPAQYEFQTATWEWSLC